MPCYKHIKELWILVPKCEVENLNIKHTYENVSSVIYQWL